MHERGLERHEPEGALCSLAHNLLAEEYVGLFYFFVPVGRLIASRVDLAQIILVVFEAKLKLLESIAQGTPPVGL